MRAILAAAAAAAAAAAGILAGTVAGAPTSSVQIAFSNAKAVWLIGADGSGLRKLTRSAFSDGGIAWSRDGRLLAFSRYFGDTGCGKDQICGDLYLIGVNGKGQRRLTSTGCTFSPPGSPAFAPKGQILAFADDSGILLAKAPNWKPRVISGHGLFPSWAPDARRLVLADGPVLEILDTVTGTTRRLGSGDFAVWSHKSNSIAYKSGGALLLVHPPGGPIRRLATADHIDDMAWSPGDDRIAYSTSVGDQSTTSWIVSLADGKRVKLGAGSFPNWSPDGTALTVEANGNLYLVRADGSGRHRLTKGFGAAWAPSP